MKPITINSCCSHISCDRLYENVKSITVNIDVLATRSCCSLVDLLNEKHPKLLAERNPLLLLQLSVVSLSLREKENAHTDK